MSSGMSVFVSVGIILTIGIYLNYKMRLRSKKHASSLESDVKDFDRAVQRHDLPEIYRIGRDLIYNTSVTLIIVNKIEAVAQKLAPNYPEFVELKNEVMNKKLRWRALDDVARARQNNFN